MGITINNRNGKFEKEEQEITKKKIGGSTLPSTSTATTTNNSSDMSARRRMQLLLSVILILSIVIFIWVGSVAEDEQTKFVEDGIEEVKIIHEQHQPNANTNNATTNNSNTNNNSNNNDQNSNNENNLDDVTKVDDGHDTKTNKEEVSSSSSSSSTTTTTEGDGMDSSTANDSSSKTTAASGSCSDVCNSRKEKRKELYDGFDILDRDGLLEAIRNEKENLISKLHVDYGQENFENIFVDKEATSTAAGGEQRYRSKQPVTDNGISIAALKRKFLIKILTVQTILKKKEIERTGCNCWDDNNNNHNTIPKNTQQQQQQDNNVFNDPTTYYHERYVWATGGHSAAAGHGNMYNESYTAYMERDLKPIFAVLGIEFEGRNYAMGGTVSGYEISMCFEQVFGTDVDFFSWDYGMTDGQAYIRLFHYGYRGGISPGHPPIIGFHIGGRSAGRRVDYLKALENLGMPAFYGISKWDEEMYSGIPDSEGKSDKEINAMPEYVRNLKCGTALEKGDPYCGKYKYTNYICSPRAKQASWHPGYKVHAIDGHSLALFMIQYLIDALKDLVANPEKDPEMLLGALKKEDDESYQSFLSKSIPESMKIFEPKDGEDNYGIENEMFFKGPSVCRTARLPAQSRYLGIMTDNGKVGGIAPFTQEKYETGIAEGVARSTSSESNEMMRLVYGEDGKERDRKCTSTILKPDYKDFIYSHQKDGLTKLVFPNDAEKTAYRYDSSTFKGVLIIYFAACDWGKCPAGDMKEDSLAEGNIEMFVNGKQVTSLVDIGMSARMLVGEDGAYWKVSSNDDYEIGVRVKEPNAYLRLSAVILY